jgi:hypothetical protein
MEVITRAPGGEAIVFALVTLIALAAFGQAAGRFHRSGPSRGAAALVTRMS